jgi:hypothetical protein
MPPVLLIFLDPSRILLPMTQNKKAVGKTLLAHGSEDGSAA